MKDRIEKSTVNPAVREQTGLNNSRKSYGYSKFGGRLKTAAKILFGKPVYYSDVYIEKPERFRKFVEDLNKLC